MRTKINITKTRIPLYRYSLWVVISNNISNAIDHVEDLISVKIQEDAAKKSTRALTCAYEDEHGRMRYILFLRHDSMLGEVAHECKHLVNIIFAWCGVKLSVTNDEHECYFLEAVVDKVYAAIETYNKKFPPVRIKAVGKSKVNTVEIFHQNT